MADACARRNVPLLAFSSPFVFDGKGERPYVESDAPSPGCAWGKLQARAEELLLEINPRALLVRTSALFGAADRSNFIMETLRALEGGKPVQATADAIVSPTFVPDLVHAALELLIDGEKGVWHLTNAGTMSWLGLAELAAAQVGHPWKPAVPPGNAHAPHMAALSSTRGSIMPTLQSAVARYVRDLGSDRRKVKKAA